MAVANEFSPSWHGVNMDQYPEIREHNQLPGFSSPLQPESLLVGGVSSIYRIRRDLHLALLA